jgi:hypothetical protein
MYLSLRSPAAKNPPRIPPAPSCAADTKSPQKKSRGKANPFPPAKIVLLCLVRISPRHTARVLGGQNPKKKNVLSILEKITPAKIRKSKEHFFFLGLPSEARRWRGFRGAYDSI